MKRNVGDIVNGFTFLEKLPKRGYWKVKHRCGNILDFRICLVNRQKYCKGCLDDYIKNNHGSKHKSWKGVGDLSSDLFTTIKLNARDRKLDFDLDLEYLWNLFLSQERKCALSGLDIYLNEKCDEKKYKTATLDRIDSKSGYIKGNVQWLHRDVNKIKNNLPEDYLFKICEKIYLTLLSKQNQNLEIEGNIFYKNGNFIKTISHQ
jgi:hypothetical protein